MKNCLITELKTLLYSKVVWIVFVVFLAFSSYLVVVNYSNVPNRINMYSSSLDELEALSEDTVIDQGSLENFGSSVNDAYRAVHPSMTLNNLFGLLLGVGLIFIPLISVLYIGADYRGNKAIKAKITYYSIGKTILAKMIMICFLIALAVTIVTIAGSIYCNIKWNSELDPLFEQFADRFNRVTNSDFKLTAAFPNNLETLIIVFAVLIFRSFICSLITFAAKNSIIGLLSVFAFTYIRLPLNFTPQGIFNNLIMEFLFQNQASMFQYYSVSEPLPVHFAVILLTGYFALMSVGYYLLKKIQRN